MAVKLIDESELKKMWQSYWFPEDRRVRRLISAYRRLRDRGKRRKRATK